MHLAPAEVEARYRQTLLHSPSLNRVCVFTARAVAFGENLTGDADGAFASEELLESRQAFFGDATELDGDFDLLLRIDGAIRG